MIHSSPNVEHLLETLLPLLNQFGRGKYQESLNGTVCQERPQDQACFDGLPHANIVRNEQPDRPGLEGAVTNPKLVRQERNPRPGEDAPGIVHRPDRSGLNPQCNLQRGRCLLSTDGIVERRDDQQFRRKNLLDSVGESDDRGIAVGQHHLADTMAQMPDADPRLQRPLCFAHALPPSVTVCCSVTAVLQR